LRAAIHTFWALFIAELKVDHAVFTAVPTALTVVWVYAAFNAVVRAAYAAVIAVSCAAIAALRAVSRADTAAPTHVILAATSVALAAFLAATVETFSVGAIVPAAV
jgi:hypothetical protein